MADYSIPLPPLSEQQRVVAKAEALLARVNASRQRLAKVPAILKRFRQSVLAAACSGRLTAKWREAHADTEPAVNLVARIRQERRCRWEADNSHKPYFVPDESHDDSALPPSWSLCRAEGICEFITKGTTPPPETMSSNGKIPFIKVYNLGFDGALHFNVNPTFISAETHRGGPLARSVVYPGNVLMNLVGPPLGKVAVCPDSFPEWNCNQAIAIYRPLPGISSWYFAYCLLMAGTLQNVIMLAKTTAGQHNLTLEMARDVRLPVPPLAEQHEIVRRVEALFRLADAIEKRVAAARARAEKLTQAILAKAFRGELVPTEAELARREGRDYEPASVLLERIRAERETTTEKAAASGRRKRKQN